MSQPHRPAFQKGTTKSSTGTSSSAHGRWSTGYSAGVSPVRGLSPVTGPSHAVARQEMEASRSHTNPLFASRMSDIGRTHTTPTKAGKDAKENREKQPSRTPVEKALYGGKSSLSTTPGRAERAAPSPAMRFATPPKPTVKRKILAENRECTSGTPSRLREDKAKKVGRLTHPDWVGPDEPASQPTVQDQEDGHHTPMVPSMLSSDRQSTDSSKPKSPLASIEELQKRIQKFLQDENAPVVTDAPAPISPLSCPDDSIAFRRLSGPSTKGDEESAAAYHPVFAPCSPRPDFLCAKKSPNPTPPSECPDDSITFRRLSGPSMTGEDVSGLDEESAAPYHPVFAPYTPRPDFLCARKSPTSIPSMEGNVSPLGKGVEADNEEKAATTPAFYDPKNNFLSPRPQFLRYRPQRRLDILRKSAEGLLGDLEVESPATCADSGRAESDGEDVESQDGLSQDSSSPSPSVHVEQASSSPEGVLARHAAEEDGEIIEAPITAPAQKTWNSVTSPKILPVGRNGGHPEDPVDLSEVDDGGEVDEEDAALEICGKSSRPWASRMGGMISLLAVVALLVVAAGSPGLLPASLHDTGLSYLWKTSESTRQFRRLLQTADGLWAGDAGSFTHHASGFPGADIMRYVSSGALTQSVDLDRVVDSGKVLLAFCTRWGGRLGTYVAEAYEKLRAQVEHYSSGSPIREATEWDWISDDDLLGQCHEGQKGLAKRRNAIDGSSRVRKGGANFSVCVLPRAAGLVVPSVQRAASPPLDSVRAIEPVPGQREVEDEQEESSAVARRDLDSGEGELDSAPTFERGGTVRDIVAGGFADPVLSGHDSELVEPEVGDTYLGDATKGIGTDEGVEIPLSTGIYTEDPIAELSRLMDGDLDLGVKFPELEDMAVSGDASTEIDAANGEPAQGLTRSFLQKLKSGWNSRVGAAAIGLWVLLLTGAVLLAVQRAVRGSSNAPSTAISNVSQQLGPFSMLSSEPGPTEEGRLHHDTFEFQPLDRSFGSTYLSGDSPSLLPSYDYLDQYASPIAVTPSYDYLHQFSTSSAASPAYDYLQQFSTPTAVTPERTHNAASDPELPPLEESDFIHGEEGGLFSLGKSLFTRPTQEAPVEASSGTDARNDPAAFGRFTTIVPVVRNEGTVKEQVQLTPVKRSMRIRTKMRSPCGPMHAPHQQCSCERSNL